MTEITIHHYLILSALLFCLGLIGVIVRKNLLVMLMCIEVMMNAINLTFVALARYFNTPDGHVMAIFVMAIAAVEAAIGLGIVIMIFRNKESIQADDYRSMKG
ncbi:MAG: NADH-quinone oxidoreductase subunit NuoK [bacterium]|nr:NADH-quinone oxidoreductase subunit NuoK [bacterium]MBU1918146.1 NADH-quinone oxidoreductase subunit NuoK [bacterium]